MFLKSYFNLFVGPQNPEDVAGIKEAITILENHDSEPGKVSNNVNILQVITPQPLVDERNNHRVAIRNETLSPVYRANRNYNDSAKRTSTKRNSPQTQNSSDFKSVVVNADKNSKKDNKHTSSAENSRRQTSSAENTSRTTSAENIGERKHRRRMTLKHNNATTTSTATVLLTSITPIESTTPVVEIIKQEIQKIYTDNPSEVRQVKLTDQLESADSIGLTILTDAKNSPAVKRFYRSSAESESNKEDQEMTFVNNEKVQIVRPTAMVKLVGQYATPTATIAMLDEAVLGIPNSRVKKEVGTAAERHENQRRSTNRFRT